jgi:hypothetical protein
MLSKIKAQFHFHCSERPRGGSVETLRRREDGIEHRKWDVGLYPIEKSRIGA